MSTASVSLDQPKAGPLLLKYPHLEEHITMYEEDAISLGDDEPFAHEPFADDKFDEINAMVLDCYNAPVKSRSTLVGGPVKSGQKWTKEKGRGWTRV